MNNRTARIARLIGVVEATAVFLFFYQALRVLFSVLFGVIYDAIFAEIVPVTTVGLWLGLVILALLTPLAAPRRPHAQRIALLVGAVLVFVARIPLTFDDPQVRLVASILVVAGTGLYLATRLRDGPRAVIRALILALVVDQLLRAAGHTWDATLRQAWWPEQVGVSLALGVLAAWLSRQRHGEEPIAGTRFGLLGGLAWGGWLFLETSLLAFPNVVARWSGAPYPGVAPLLLAVTLLPLVEGDRWRARRGRLVGLTGLVILLIGLALGGLPTSVAVSTLALLLAQLAVLVLLPACFPPGGNGSKDRLGAGLAVGGVLFLILSFAYAFAFTYPYTVDIFRDMGLPVILVAGLLSGLPTLRRPVSVEPCAGLVDKTQAAALGLALIVFIALLTWPRAPHPPAEASSLRVATYNIHYGYDADWRLSLEAQAQTIEAAGADAVMLQEVDAGRATSYMVDDALWLAHHLGMEAVYLPCVEHLTGIALLSRYPILDSDTLLLPSELEQTGIIWAELGVGDAPVNAFAIWMGLEPEERARQLDAALPFIAAHPGPAVFGGDFNSAPESPVYARIAGAGFVDPFVVLGLGSPPTDPAINPRERIDFVWQRDLTPVDAQVLESTASDHRLVVVEADLP